MKILSPTQLTELCHSISLPPEITDAVLSIQSSKEFTDLLPQARPLLEELLTPATWDSALVRLKALIGEDPLGIKILTLMLICCGETWRSYQSLGISGDIYIETLKCFTRFINEHQESYGVFGFDRDFWTMRQLAARLFRLGTLEFELTEDGEGKAVHVHIPSDADLSPEARHRSYDMARDFIARFSPAYKGAPFLCTSWLLSPALRECLPKGSRIRFTWVYKRPDIPLPDLPEGTSLQRNLKKYLLAGGKVGEGKGRLLCKRI